MSHLPWHCRSEPYTFQMLWFLIFLQALLQSDPASLAPQRKSWSLCNPFSSKFTDANYYLTGCWLNRLFHIIYFIFLFYEYSSMFIPCTPSRVFKYTPLIHRSLFHSFRILFLIPTHFFFFCSCWGGMLNWKSFFLLHLLKEKLFKSIFSKSYWGIPKIPKIQFIHRRFFPMLFAAKTLWKFWTRLSRNYILKIVVKISRIPLDRFCSNLQGLCKKVLSSEPWKLFWKKKIWSPFIYKKLMKNGVKI